MKKILYLITALGLGCGLVSCDLDLTPDTDVAGPDAAALIYVKGLRNGIYNQLTTVSGYDYMRYPEYYTDLFNETTNSGNRGGYFSRWMLNATDQDVNAIWSNYYTVVRSVNYAIMRAGEAAANDPDNAEELNFYKGELHLIRAYVFHQLALRFCEDYEPDRAASQPGVPTPTSYNPAAQLNRGTLEQTYRQILDDIAAAEKIVDTPGAADSPYVTVDAITALKAQVALQMHRYDDAIGYARSLYAGYPLITSKSGMEKMWLQDTSTETIFQLSLTSTTLPLVDNTTYDYSSGTWNAAGYFIYSPAYVPEQWVCDLFDTAKDYRYGPCIEASHIKELDNGANTDGWLMVKLTGNRDLFTTPTVLTYKNMPKIFRIAEMYLIEAEAQYRNNGDALTPLNALRGARGLDAVSSTGEALFKDIQDESVREFIGEGRRLFDLKRWHQGIARDAQTACVNLLTGGSSVYELTVSASNSKWVWPVPQEELHNNPNFGSQNEGYVNN